jgi:Tol biopolymer transport system component
MHHRMPLSKTGWPCLNVVIFAPMIDAPRPGRPKSVTIPEIIDQIHELILADRQNRRTIPEHITNLNTRWSQDSAAITYMLTKPNLGNPNPNGIYKIFADQTTSAEGRVIAKFRLSFLAKGKRGRKGKPVQTTACPEGMQQGSQPGK